jgi:hypothetical protein
MTVGREDASCLHYESARAPKCERSLPSHVRDGVVAQRFNECWQGDPEFETRKGCAHTVMKPVTEGDRGWRTRLRMTLSPNCSLRPIGLLPCDVFGLQ